MNTSEVKSLVETKATIEKLKRYDLEQNLSYGGGVNNAFGVRKTNTTIRLRLINTMETDQKVYISPSLILGTDLTDPASRTEIVEFLGLDSNAMFVFDGVKTAVAPAKGACSIRSLDSTQNIKFISSTASFEPYSVVAVSMKSFTAQGVPENTNYGNSITHYNVSAWREKKRSTPLNFQDFQSSKDVSTEIMKIDLINSNFDAPVSQSDILEILVNAGTRLDLTFHIGARDSQTERFYRNVKGIKEMLNSEFPNPETHATCNC